MKDIIEKHIDMNASLSRVWKALTDHNQFGAWFRVKLDAPFAEGKESTGFITWPGMEHLRWTAVVVKIQPQNYFAFTWHPYAIDPKVDYSKEESTLVEFRLEEVPGGTRLKLTESGFEKIPAHRRAEAFRMNGGGWAKQMENIQEYVQSL